jgi:predicted dehydrogenase
MDGDFQFVAGALSSSPERAKASAAELGLDPARSYASYQEMAKAEAKRPDGIEAVSIVTPNNVHYPAAKAFLEAGIHVICDKPLTSNLADAKKLAALVEKTGKVFVLTHNYTAYPMVRQAREMVAKGQLGDIRLVQAEYPQDWLTEDLAATGQKQASWRTDPRQTGAGGASGDIGTHAYNLARFVSGLELAELSADLDAFVPGRLVDDNLNVLLRFKPKGKEPGAKGMIWASQVAPGHENGLKVRVYGTKGGLEWVQADPNYLWYTPFGQPKQLITRNGAGAGPAAARVSRVPPGHPEGYLEGFANIYQEAARAIRAARKKGGKPGKDVIFPTVADGVEGMAFIEACVRSSKKNAAWTTL